MSKFCYICYSQDVYISEEEYLICDMCGECYCYDCSYTFTIHYQHEGSRCHLCSDQKRNNKITKTEIRNNKLNLIL